MIDLIYGVTAWPKLRGDVINGQPCIVDMRIDNIEDVNLLGMNATWQWRSKSKDWVIDTGLGLITYDAFVAGRVFGFTILSPYEKDHGIMRKIYNLIFKKK